MQGGECVEEGSELSTLGVGCIRVQLREVGQVSEDRDGVAVELFSMEGDGKDRQSRHE